MDKENKLIAEFMGYVYYKHMPKKRNGYQLPENKNTALYLAFSDAELKYNTSWDWLMPVIKKIKNKFLAINIDVYDKFESEVHEIEDAIWDNNIEEAYRLAVVMINTYNENK